MSSGHCQERKKVVGRFNLSFSLVSVALFAQLVVQDAQLVQEAHVGPDLAAATHQAQGLGGRHPLLDHQIGGHGRGRARKAQETGDENQAPVKALGAIDEIGHGLKSRKREIKLMECMGKIYQALGNVEARSPEAGL